MGYPAKTTGPGGHAPGGRRRTAGRQRDREGGFSLIDTVMTIAVMSILSAVSVSSVTHAVKSMKSDAGMTRVMAQIREAREIAITQRRPVLVEFLGQNEIRTSRLEIPSGSTLLNHSYLEGSVEFLQFQSVPDTPDQFGADAPVDIGGATSLVVRADGLVVDSSGAPVSGTIFLGTQDEPATARAVTVFSGTGRVRGYRWNGTGWLQ